MTKIEQVKLSKRSRSVAVASCGHRGCTWYMEGNSPEEVFAASERHEADNPGHWTDYADRSYGGGGEHEED